MPSYSAEEQRNIDTVTAMFEAGRELDRSTLFADDATWWNGLPFLPSQYGQTEHHGIEAIRGILGGSGRPHPGTGIDSYDLATNRFTDVVVLADGTPSASGCSGRGRRRCRGLRHVARRGR
jgi:ketosteroid isomerase-like protein